VANITEETGEVCPIRMLRGPRCGTGFAEFLESFRRLLEATVEFGRRFEGAGVPSEAFADQTPTVVSEELERIREEGAWTAMDSIPQVWP
jgi:hypothetical protein